jgi:hypothetical protein
MSRLLVSLLMIVLLPITCALARTGSEDEQKFIFNNATFYLYHEIGHLLIGELELPVLGREEDAADHMATILLLFAETAEAEPALTDSAVGWFLSDELDTSETYEDFHFYDTHSLDLQRAYNVVCLMVGADREKYGPTADEVGMDAERQEECESELSQILTSWIKVLEPFEADDNAPSDIIITYGETRDYTDVKAFFENKRFLENAAEQIVAGYSLPRQVKLSMLDCDAPNAYYDPNEHAVVFCYQMADHLADLYALWIKDEKK